MQDGEMQTPHHDYNIADVQTERSIFADNEVQTKHYDIEDEYMQTDLKEFKEIEIQSESPYKEKDILSAKDKSKIITVEFWEQSTDDIIIAVTRG